MDSIPSEDKDRVIIIGDRTDEVYLDTILSKFVTYDYIYIQVLAFPKKLIKVEEYYQKFRWLGIRRVEKIFDIPAPAWNNPNMKARIFKWELIPRLINYRTSVVKVEIEEEMERRVI